MQYVANTRLPSRNAHSYQIVKMCDAFVANGHSVELIIPNRDLTSDAPNSVEEYFDTPVDFEVTRLPCVDYLTNCPHPSLLRLAFYVQTVTFTLAAILYSVKSETDILYTRALLFGIIGSLVFSRSLTVEVHRGRRDWVATVIGDLFQRVNGLVVISEGLEERWRTFTSAPILVAPDGVDIDRFEDGSGIPVPNRPETSPSRQVATYAGSLKGWKGVDTLIQAAGFVPDVEVWILGGTALQHQRMEEASGPFPPNVQMIERVNPAEVPKYLAASDVLVLPNTAEQRISQQYTSPLKLFEYMAVRRPIVASKIPSLTEILDNSCAYFAVPDDPESFGKTIRHALDDPEARQKAKQAREAVKKYTWLNRAQIITEFLEQEG